MLLFHAGEYKNNSKHFKAPTAVLVNILWRVDYDKKVERVTRDRA